MPCDESVPDARPLLRPERGMGTAHGAGELPPSSVSAVEPGPLPSGALALGSTAAHDAAALPRSGVSVPDAGPLRKPSGPLNLGSGVACNRWVSRAAPSLEVRRCVSWQMLSRCITSSLPTYPSSSAKSRDDLPWHYAQPCVWQGYCFLIARTDKSYETKYALPACRSPQASPSQQLYTHIQAAESPWVDCMLLVQLLG